MHGLLGAYLQEVVEKQMGAKGQESSWWHQHIHRVYFYLVFILKYTYIKGHKINMQT